MGFEIGKEVICIRSNNKTIQQGKVYTIEGIKRNPCCGQILLNIGIKNNIDLIRCIFCGETRPNDYYYLASRFAPIDDISIEELTEVLQKEPFQL